MSVIQNRRALQKVQEAAATSPVAQPAAEPEPETQPAEPPPPKRRKKPDVG